MASDGKIFPAPRCHSDKIMAHRRPLPLPIFAAAGLAAWGVLLWLVF